MFQAAARLMTVMMAAACLLPLASAQACEKHARGHQNSADTDVEYSRQR